MKNQHPNIKKRQIWKTFLAYPAAAFVILEAVDFLSLLLGTTHAKTNVLSPLPGHGQNMQTLHLYIDL